MENNHINSPNYINIPNNSQKSILIVYKSKYGATKDYVKWLEKALADRQIACDICQVDKTPTQDFCGYGAVVFAGGIYGGELSIAKSLKDFARHLTEGQKATPIPNKLATPKLHCILIGLSSPLAPHQSTLDKNFTPSEQESIEFHFLQGRLDFGKLDSVDRERMNAYREMLRARASRTSEQEALLENDAVDFASKDSLKCVIDSLVAKGE
ncbi:flavodoxin domain-containing protein [Helicobacter macacae]|uniref:Flavodoxin domain-containing protein n=1 Tax=Helicobacter macacae MIT 99-5501 TaxID=1357400 RepID=V8C7J4_9HELI|nr:flavodoxin domain-containing protein [Helicobacter macacae]ETD23022.1 hypothetical protein HMPREF2086_01469 [Helicobacter macacae MIT 99-5501]